jgi:hypothetical protein
VDRLEAERGDISLAAEIQLLKRALSRGNTPVVLGALRRAFSLVAREAPVTFPEYDSVRRHFRESDIPVGPTIALDALGHDEGEDSLQA